MTAGTANPMHPDVPSARAGGGILTVDAAVGAPVALAGLRQVLRAARELAPDTVSAIARLRPAAWNCLFPGTFTGVGVLADAALTPSERRLHRESEQAYWILNLAARTLVEVLRETGATLKVEGAGASDLVSLRALMRAREWARLEGLEDRLVIGGFSHAPALVAGRYRERRLASLKSLALRMGTSFDIGTSDPRAFVAPAPVDDESRFLAMVLDPAAAPEQRMAAAVQAIRLCFFSTNYEGALIACETGLDQLRVLGDGFSESRLRDAWRALDSVASSPAIEIDEASLGDADEMRALFERSVGVVQAFSGDFEEALASFGRGLEGRLSPERQAQLRAYRALTSMKRLGALPQARAEIGAGLEVLANSSHPDRFLQEGWLRNVFALTYFQEKQLVAALNEEKLAMKCVGDLHDPSATHLKINLISNVSVVQETARQFADSIATWRRFEAISGSWGENFAKHHRYRLAGLELKAGRRDEAVVDYSAAYESAVRLGDDFHAAVIAAGLGQMHLDGVSAVSTEWYAKALGHARETGEPLRIAECQVGLALASGGDTAAALPVLAADSTWPEASSRLRTAVEGGDAKVLGELLPKPKSKLNRPFDAVNLY